MRQRNRQLERVQEELTIELESMRRYDQPKKKRQHIPTIQARVIYEIEDNEIDEDDEVVSKCFDDDDDCCYSDQTRYH